MITKKAVAKKGSEFHVVLGDIKLSAEAEARVQAQIQSLVMGELAGYKPDPEDPDGTLPGTGRGGRPVIVIPPIPWPGLIIYRDLVKLEQIKDIQKQLNKSWI